MNTCNIAGAPLAFRAQVIGTDLPFTVADSISRPNIVFSILLTVENPDFKRKPISMNSGSCQPPSRNCEEIAIHRSSRLFVRGQPVPVNTTGYHTKDDCRPKGEHGINQGRFHHFLVLKHGASDQNGQCSVME